ncbi:hypothetical protein LINPERHAP1_LOCUS3191 [Linum perenne]
MSIAAAAVCQSDELGTCFPCRRSVESPLYYPLNLKKEDVVWVWNTEKQAWKTCSQPEESPREDLDLPSNCSSFEFPGSNIQCKRRKVSGNSLIVFPETACLDELDCDSEPDCLVEPDFLRRTKKQNLLLYPRGQALEMKQRVQIQSQRFQKMIPRVEMSALIFLEAMTFL